MLSSEIETMKGLNYQGRTIVQARSGRRQAWGTLAWEGQVTDAWHLLPDGRDVWDVLQEGDLAALPPCWISVRNTGAYGDMMWSSAMMFSFISEPFAAALQAAGIQGFQLLPLDVQPKRGERFPGYFLLLPDNSDQDAPIRSFPFPYRPTAAIDISAEVMKALAGAGVNAFESEDAVDAAARHLEVADD